MKKLILFVIILLFFSNLAYSQEDNRFEATLKQAEEGDASSQYELGAMYRFGRHGVAKDYKEAAKWYTKAAEQRHVEAQFLLGIMYAKDVGVAKDYKQAIKWLTKAAEQEHTKAQHNLGIIYGLGLGVAQDEKQSVKWYTKAAERGHSKAQYKLGLMYVAGRGVTQDYKESVKWYTKAAEQGHIDAQLYLWVIYSGGEGITKDHKEAAKWYTKATEQGHAKAEFRLGLMYDWGRGVTKDSREAAKWYIKAAERGYASAQNKLAPMYAFGTGVIEDYIEAYKWALLAEADGHDLLKFKEMLKSKMSAGQIVEAQKLAKAFKPKTKQVESEKGVRVEIYAENAPADYIQQECLPILNNIVDTLHAAKYKFPELAQLERRHIKKPFGQFLYQFRVEAVRGRKAMRIAPGGCSISLFLESFTRKKTGREGVYTRSSRHSKIYSNKEFDDLAIRLNYELRVGTPNEDLQELFSTLVKQGISELAKKAEAFRGLKNGASPE